MFKICRFCGKKLPRAKAFYCSEQHKWGFYKKIGRTKQYRLNNREYRLEYMIKWRQDHPSPHTGMSPQSWMIGNIPWNKGLTKKDPRVLENVTNSGLSKRGKHYPNMGRRGKWIKENNPRWKGGITAINAKIRGGSNYQKWRNAVFERDRFTCQHCGFVMNGKNQIVAHHLKSFAEYPELRFDIENGVTVCRVCHISIDSKLDDKSMTISSL